MVLAAFLTLVTVVFLFAFAAIPGQTGEVVMALIVFAAWYLAISLVMSLFQQRRGTPGPERSR